MKEVKRGDIYDAYLSPTTGHEQNGQRPVLILQNNIGNLYSPTTIVAMLTTKRNGSRLPTHVPIRHSGLLHDSTILLEQIRTIDKSHLGKFIGVADFETMRFVDKALSVSIGIKNIEGDYNGKSD